MDTDTYEFFSEKENGSDCRDGYSAVEYAVLDMQNLKRLGDFCTVPICTDTTKYLRGR